ncbi:MAG: hypothetical protein ACI9FN_003997, partial [Saprospiraceae bacterium]
RNRKKLWFFVEYSGLVIFERWMIRKYLLLG